MILSASPKLPRSKSKETISSENIIPIIVAELNKEKSSQKLNLNILSASKYFFCLINLETRGKIAIVVAMAKRAKGN